MATVLGWKFGYYLGEDRLYVPPEPGHDLGDAPEPAAALHDQQYWGKLTGLPPWAAEMQLRALAGKEQGEYKAGAEMIGDNDFRDPWGNHFQVVDYRDIQFTKTDRILEGMSLAGLRKSDRAIDELRAKGLAG